MAFDVEKWLKEDLGLTEDELKAVQPHLTGKADKLEKGQLRQADYSRQMNDLKKTQGDLKVANDKLTADMAEWASLTAAEKAESGDLKAKIDAAEAKAFQLQQKIVRLAESTGIDPKTVLEGDPVLPKKEEVAPVFDPSPLVQQMGGIADYMLSLNAKLPRIAREHKALTGTEFDEDAFIDGIRADMKSGKKDVVLDPMKRWEAANDIPAKRAAASAAQRQSELDAAREEGRIAARSEAMLPNAGGRPQHPGSPAFRTVGEQSVLKRPQAIDRLSGARAALAAGKYRTDGSPPK